MPTNLDKYRGDLAKLITTGDQMLTDLNLRYRGEKGDLRKKEEKDLATKMYGTFEMDYQGWFSEASAVVHQLMPNRIGEFLDLYRSDIRRKGITVTTYSIQDWLNGVRAGTNVYSDEKAFDDLAAVTMRFTTQIQILKATERRFESSLFDIQQVVQADLLDSEVDAAREVAKHGFLRAAGAIAGVVLEKHLGQVASNHSVTVRKKNPNIAELNDSLKDTGVIDVPVWRQIQQLGDIRNICVHNRQREPTAEEVNELIDGVGKITKTLF